MNVSNAVRYTINTVMLIDDEPIDQKMYKRIIERSGLVRNVTSFSYAEDALKHLSQPNVARPDVIFLDINMPRMNGFEFLAEATAALGEDFAQMVVVMLTTSLNPIDRERAEAFAVVKDFINKPLTVAHLQKIAQTLEPKP